MGASTNATVISLPWAFPDHAHFFDHAHSSRPLILVLATADSHWWRSCSGPTPGASDRLPRRGAVVVGCLGTGPWWCLSERLAAVAAVGAGLSVRERREDGSPGPVLLGGEGQVARLRTERSRRVAVVAVVARRGPGGPRSCSGESAASPTPAPGALGDRELSLVWEERG